MFPGRFYEEIFPLVEAKNVGVLVVTLVPRNIRKRGRGLDGDNPSFFLCGSFFFRIVPTMRLKKSLSVVLAVSTMLWVFVF